jgi:hypothetical protein
VSDGAETDLAGALEFSSADLAANRDGVLSESQRARFDAVRATWEAGAARSRPMMIVLGSLGLAAAVALAVYGLTRAQPSLAIFVAAGLTALGGGLTIRYPEALFMKVPAPPTRIAVVEGPATMGDEEGAGWGGRVYFVRVQGHQFDVGVAGQRAFTAGRSYRCYYVDRATWVVGRSGLLSAEPTPARAPSGP